jgi:Ca2+-binding RTX toxin-like protein
LHTARVRRRADVRMRCAASRRAPIAFSASMTDDWPACEWHTIRTAFKEATNMSLGKVRLTLAVVAVITLLARPEARAQTAATCSFDPATATVRVNVNGLFATVSSTGAAGIIRVDEVACGAATTTNTDRIVIRGGALVDNISLRGVFGPGLTPEADAVSEIEISLISIQNFTWRLGAGNDTLVSNGGTSLDFGGDGDTDVTGGVIGSIQGGPGDDLLDLSAHTGNFTLSGQGGNDHLIAGSGHNTLIGNDGDDTLEGNAGNDRLDGGPGNDVEFGDGGVDTFAEDGIANGSDQMFGGPQRDTVDYGSRTVAVNVTLGAGTDDDGEAGEGDNVGNDVENAVGGDGNDTLVGSASQNTLTGGDGDDSLSGGGNRDLLFGGEGNDTVQGGAGGDDHHGEGGNDTLIGDPSAGDRYFGGDGDDQISGNTDGRVEPVNCGAGTDTVEPNEEDNFIDCEL